MADYIGQMLALLIMKLWCYEAGGLMLGLASAAAFISIVLEFAIKARIVVAQPVAVDSLTIKVQPATVATNA